MKKILFYLVSNFSFSLACSVPAEFVGVVSPETWALVEDVKRCREQANAMEAECYADGMRASDRVRAKLGLIESCARVATACDKLQVNLEACNIDDPRVYEFIVNQVLYRYCRGRIYHFAWECKHHERLIRDVKHDSQHHQLKIGDEQEQMIQLFANNRMNLSRLLQEQPIMDSPPKSFEELRRVIYNMRERSTMMTEHIATATVEVEMKNREADINRTAACAFSQLSVANVVRALTARAEHGASAAAA